MDPWCALSPGAPQRFAIEGDSGRLLRGRCWGTAKHVFCPGPQCRFDDVTGEMPKDCVERRSTGGFVGETERLRESYAIILPPFRDSTVAAIPTSHGTTRQREDSG